MVMVKVITVTPDQLSEIVREEVQAAVCDAMQERSLPILLTLKEAADILGVSHTTMYRVSKVHDFPVTHDFGHVKVVTDQMLEWIKDSSNHRKVYEI